MNEIEKKTKVGVLWSTLTTGVGQIITFSMGIVLARLLSPKDFGIFAAIIIFIEIGSSIISSGFVTALVQRQNINKYHYSTALTIQIALAVLVYIVIFCVSPWIGKFYNNELIGKVMAVTSIYLLILPFISIPTAILRKKIDFRATGTTEILNLFSNGFTAIVLAYLGFGVWSIVYGKLVGHTITAIRLAYQARWRPQFSLKREAAKDFIAFSFKVTVINILNDLANNIGYTLVGRFLGPIQLGYYYRAYYIMTLPLNRIVYGMTNVLFSAFSELQNDEIALKNGLLKSVCYISLITFPILTGLFWVCPAFIHFLYGEKWMGTVLPLRIMAFAGMLFSIEPVAVSAIVAKGFVGLEVKRQLTYFIILLIGISVGSHWGIIGVSCAVLFGAAVFMIMLQILLHRILHLSWTELWTILAPALSACGVMSITVYAYQHSAVKILALLSPTMLFSTVTIGMLVYFSFLYIIKNRVKHHILAEVFTELESYIWGAFRWRYFHQPK